jgi:type III secretion protein D
MESATNFNSFVTEWLARLARGQRAALTLGARRFTSLMAQSSELEVARADAQGVIPALLRITSGLHRGASMELTHAEYLVGSADECDIVLRGPQVAARHCILSREWSGIVVRDLRAGAAQPTTAGKVSYEGGAIEAEYDIGGLHFTVRHPPTQKQERAHKRQASWFLGLAVAAGVIAVVTLTASSGAQRWRLQAAVQQVDTLNRTLAQQGFGSVHLGRDTQGDLQVSGIVTDTAHRRHLEEWLAAQHLDDAHLNVVVTSELVDEARRALGADELSVRPAEGRLLVEGKTSRTQLQGRIRSLAADLRGTVMVEDHVVYIADADNTPGPLPVRVQGVMIGAPSYFMTDSGVRYFVGGVLPDGAEVLSIDQQAIQFRRAGAVVTYKLQ